MIDLHNGMMLPKKEASFSRRPDTYTAVETSKPTTFNAPASTIIPRSQIREQPHEPSNPQTSSFLYHVEVH